jgi:hypothetical protein
MRETQAVHTQIHATPAGTDSGVSKSRLFSDSVAPFKLQSGAGKGGIGDSEPGLFSPGPGNGPRGGRARDPESPIPGIRPESGTPVSRI